MKRSRSPKDIARRGGESWAAQDHRLRKLAAAGRTNTEIAAELGRSRRAVQRRRRLLDLGDPTLWSAEELAVLREEYATHQYGSLETTERCHRRLPGRTKGAIRSQACRMGLTGMDAP